MVSTGIKVALALFVGIWIGGGGGWWLAKNPPDDNGVSDELWAHQYDDDTQRQRIGGCVSYRGVFGGIIEIRCETIQPTGSMFPALQGGTEVAIISMMGSEFRVGDIIEQPARVGERIHRVISISDGCIWTKGDALPTPDAECFPINKSYGRVVAIFP